jgi:hypothetical protein
MKTIPKPLAAILSGTLLLTIAVALAPGAKGSPGPDGIEAKKPPLCTSVKHMGKKTYIVDQAWQFYRRLERSSPLRVGWCDCAKRCEKIDRNAATIEAKAFQANKARVDPSVPPKKRKQYADRAIELFAERNETVNLFKDCLDETRPPISSDMSVPEKTLKGCVKKVSLPIEWARWCAEFEKKWGKIYEEFVADYKNKSNRKYRVAFYIETTRNGKLSWVGKGVWSKALGETDARKYIKKITDIKMRPIPEDSEYPGYQWPTEMIVDNGAPKEGRFLNEPMPCPEEGKQ